MKLNYLIKDGTFRSIGQLPEWLRVSKRDYASQIRSLRATLGMTQAQLARRSLQNSRLIRRLESGRGDPQISTLKKTAGGLECDLLIRFVPKKPISHLVRNHAEEKARQIIQLSQGTAVLEAQEPEKRYIRHQMRELVRELMDRKTSLLWEN